MLDCISLSAAARQGAVCLEQNDLLTSPNLLIPPCTKHLWMKLRKTVCN